MSTFGIIALSVLVGLFLAFIVGACGFLIWTALQFRRIVDETRITLAAHRAESATFLESFRVTLETNLVKTDAQIKSINGEKLSLAVDQFASHLKSFDEQSKFNATIATRVERATITMGRFIQELVSRDDDSAEQPFAGITRGIDQRTGYAATEPGEQPFVSASRTARDDREVLADEAGDVTQTE